MIGGEIRERRGIMMTESSDWLFANGTLDWTDHVPAYTDADLAALLGHMCIAAQRGVERLTDKRLSYGNGIKINDGESGGSAEGEGRGRREEFNEKEYFAKSGEVAKVRRRRDADGRWVTVDPPACETKVDTPGSITELNQELLHSAAIVYPGRYDVGGSSVVLVSCHNDVWDTPACTATRIAQIIIYYLTLPSEKSQSLGTALVVDARSTTLHVLNTLLEAVYITEANRPTALAIVHVLTDKLSQALLFRSPEFRPQVNLQINLVNSISSLYKFVDGSSLPVYMGGTMEHQHAHWLAYRQKYECVLSQCRTATKRLVAALHTLVTSDTLLTNTALPVLVATLNRHDDVIQQALHDPDVVHIRSHGTEVMQQLVDAADGNQHSSDYSESLEVVKSLYEQIQDSAHKLEKLAEIRTAKLQQCIQLKQFQQTSAEVLEWLESDGAQLLVDYEKVAESKAIKKQKKAFDKAYFTAMTHIEQGKYVLEDASVLAGLTDLDDASKVTDVAQKLKVSMKSFTSDLDIIRDRIENSAQCYHLLDKAYEWALNSTKFVASLKMDKTTTSEQIAGLQRSLYLYLQDNPPLTEETFEIMNDLAFKLNNEKLKEQCLVARSRCVETQELLTIRQETFQRAKERLQNTPPAAPPAHCTTHHHPQTNHHTSPHHHSIGDHHTGPGAPPQTTTTPLSALPGSMLRRRSYAGNASTPLYSSTAAAFKDKDSHVAKYEEFLFGGEGVITSDMSDRVVASLPKGLSTDSRLRASRESLRGSSENLSSDQQLQRCHGGGGGAISPTPAITSAGGGGRTNGCLVPQSSVLPRLLDCNHSLESDSGISSSSGSNTGTTPCTSTTGTGTDDLHTTDHHHQPLHSPTVPDHILETAGTITQQRRMMRRINSAPTGTSTGTNTGTSSHVGGDTVLTGAGGAGGDRYDTSSRQFKTLSMITGSTDSLPSMPEEDDQDLNAVNNETPHLTTKTSPQPIHPSNTPHTSAHLTTHSTETTGGVRGGGGTPWGSPVPVNSHLEEMTRGGGAGKTSKGGKVGSKPVLTSYHSIADLRLTDDDAKRQRTLDLIMTEMLGTERDYVKSLRFVVDHYMSELLRDDVPPALRGKRNIVFGNLEQIYAFHSRYFLTELERCQRSPYQVCHFFLEHAPEFYLYALYNKNKPRSDQIMAEHGTKFFREKQIMLGDRLDLSSYLLKPVQRMGKYALLLQQIIKECPPNNQEHADLKSALEMVQFQLRHGNDLLAMDCLKNCDVSLAEQGRLLRQDEFLVWQGRKKSMRHVFLFEDLILFSKTRRGPSGNDTYVYKMSIKMTEIGLTENVGRDADSSGLRFGIWFRRRGARDSYTIQASDPNIRNMWVRDISRLLWKQAIRNREIRLAEMSRMGMGSKPCLDLKPSRDNINDRFINVNLPSRVCRTRNSIAVSSFDHLKNGNKRPHSIISVSSSTSSSSGSGGSLEHPSSLLVPQYVTTPPPHTTPTTPAGITNATSQHQHAAMFGAPQPTVLETLLDNSTAHITKAYTICSNESGIVVDTSATSEDACTQTTLKRGTRLHSNLAAAAAASRISTDEAICMSDDKIAAQHTDSSAVNLSTDV